MFTLHELPILPNSRQLQVINLQYAGSFRPSGLKDTDITASLISNSAVLLVNRGKWIRLAASPVSTDARKNHPKFYKYLLGTGKAYFLICFCEALEVCVLYLNDHTQFQNLWTKTKVMDIVLRASGSSGPWVFLAIFPKASFLVVIVCPWMIRHLVKPSITSSETVQLQAVGYPGAVC